MQGWAPLRRGLLPIERPGTKRDVFFRTIDFQLSTSKVQLLNSARYPLAARSFQYYRILLIHWVYSERIPYVRAGSFRFVPSALARLKLLPF